MYSLTFDIRRCNWKVVLIVLLICVQLTLVAGKEDGRHTAVFCGSHVNNSITFMDVNIVNEGIIFMPNSYGNQSRPEDCTVTIRGLQNSIIIFEHQRLNASNGPCLKNNVISNKNQEGPCPEQRLYSVGMTEIILEVRNIYQPGFIINFKVYPAFTMRRSSVHSINAMTQREGYITDYSFSPVACEIIEEPSDIFVYITNLTLSATVTFNLELVNTSGSDNPLFNIDIMLPGSRTFILFNITTSIKNHMERFTGNHSFRIRFREKIPSDAREHVRLKYKVESCADTTVSYLTKLHQTQFNSSQYTSLCDTGYELENKAKSFTCHTQQWIPVLKCSKSGTAVSTALSSIPENKSEEVLFATQSNDSGRRNSEVSVKRLEYYHYIVIFVGSTLLILPLLAGSIYCSRFRFDNFYNQEVKSSRQLPIPPAMQDIEGQIQCVNSTSVYNAISSTDPYLDYCTINECDMMRNIEQSVIKPSPHNLNCKVQKPPTAVDTIKKTPTCLCPNLLDSCLSEMDKRGIRFNGSSFKAVKQKILEPQISLRSTHKAKLQRFCSGPYPRNDSGATNFASTAPTETHCQPGKHSSNLSAALPVTDHEIYLRPKSLDKEVQKMRKEGQQSYVLTNHSCEQPSTGYEADSGADNGHQVISTNSPSFIQYEDAESVYDVYFL